MMGGALVSSEVLYSVTGFWLYGHNDMTYCYLPNNSLHALGMAFAV
jgi:hypothetical protein